jgi:ribonuclease-3
MCHERKSGHIVNAPESNSPKPVDPGQRSEIRLIDDVEGVDGSDQASKLARCQTLIDYKFKDESLLLSALTHASGATNRLASNERLEFLGDAVLGLTVCHWLFETYPEYSEGDLTKIKSAVVSRRACGKIACELGLDTCLIVGRGVTRNRSFPKSLVSDVFESVVAAMYLDGGPELVRDRLREWLVGEVAIAVESQGANNFKSSLQQHAQRELGGTPIYRLKQESGPDHRKSFMICAVIGEQEFSAAWGNNKKDAEQRAAANALAELNDEDVPFPSPSDPDEDNPAL